MTRITIVGGFFENQQYTELLGWVVEKINLKTDYQIIQIITTDFETNKYDAFLNQFKNTVLTDGLAPKKYTSEELNKIEVLDTDLVISLHPIYNLVQVANHAVTKTGAKWISIITDPECDIRKKQRGWFIDLENTKLMFEKTDAIIYNDKWQQKWIEENTTRDNDQLIGLIPYDIRNIEDASNCEKIVISHIGRLTEHRCIPELAEALLKIKKKYPKAEINFIGIGSTLMKQFDLNEQFNYFDEMPIEEADAWVAKSNILISIDMFLGNDYDYYPYIPSKIFTYAGARKKILAIAIKNSPASDFMNKYGDKAVPFDKKQIYKHLKHLIKKDFQPDELFLKTLDKENLFKEYIKVIEQVMKTN